MIVYGLTRPIKLGSVEIQINNLAYDDTLSDVSINYKEGDNFITVSCYKNGAPIITGKVIHGTELIKLLEESS